jgi:hypothetical protein
MIGWIKNRYLVKTYLNVFENSIILVPVTTETKILGQERGR